MLKALDGEHENHIPARAGIPPRFTQNRSGFKGFEVMRALRKGQASAFNITRDIRGEARIVERAFGLGTAVLAEAIQFVSDRLECGAA